jgi:hypothetical protein
MRTAAIFATLLLLGTCAAAISEDFAPAAVSGVLISRDGELLVTCGTDEYQLEFVNAVERERTARWLGRGVHVQGLLYLGQSVSAQSPRLVWPERVYRVMEDLRTPRSPVAIDRAKRANPQTAPIGDVRDAVIENPLWLERHDLARPFHEPINDDVLVPQNVVKLRW